MALDTGTHTGTKTFTADAVFAAKHLVVKLTAEGTVDIAGAGDIPIGTVLDVPDAIDDPVAVKLINSGDTHKMISGAEVAVDTFVKTNDAGKVIAKSANDDVIIGRTMQAASGADETIEVLPLLFIFPTPEA